MKLETNGALKDIRKEMAKELKYKDNVDVEVKVFYTDECGYDEFMVEINYLLNGSYENGWYVETYDNEKEAKKRASNVLKTVGKWFNYGDDLKLRDDIEVYHA